MPSTAASCDSKTRAGPRKVHSSSGTPAVFTIAPSGARLPYSTASPPSAVYACATSRMHPASASPSSDSPPADRQYALLGRAPAQRLPAGRLRVRPGGPPPAGRGVVQLHRLRLRRPGPEIPVGQRQSVHRAHGAVEQPGPVQLAQDRVDAAGPVHVLDMV